MKYLWNKKLLLRGQRDGANRSSDVISVKCSHTAKSWESAAHVGSRSNVPSSRCASVVELKEVVSHLHHWKTLVL